MKYTVTPFHLLTLYFFGAGVYDFYILSKVKFDTELGELIPYLYFVFGFIVLFFDLAVQVVLGLTFKNPKKIIYIIEASLLALGGMWVWTKFFPTVHRVI